MPASIVITGASSGIGKALAFHYASQGAVLGLHGRNAERLEAVAAKCRDLGAVDVKTAILDVRARAELMAWIAQFDQTTPIDILFANAGVTGGTTLGGEFEPGEVSYALIETNVLGVFNSVHAILPAMMARGRGQIALISSLAAFIPLADSPSYCASKSAILAYGRALSDAMGPRGIGISVVCPGFVETPMSNSLLSAKPFQMSAEEAAKRIADGLERRQTVITFPWLLALVTKLGNLLPAGLRQLLSPAFRVGGISSN